MTVGLARKLSRTKPHRDALLKNMVSQLLQHGSITSTHEKCKEASRVAERVITWAKKVNANPASPLRSEIQFQADEPTIGRYRTKLCWKRWRVHQSVAFGAQTGR